MDNLKEIIEKYNGYRFIEAIVLNDGTVRITLLDSDKEVQIHFIPSITTGCTGNLRLEYHTKIVEG